MRRYGTVKLRNIKPVQYWKLVQPQSFTVATINECKNLTPYSTPEWMEREQLQNERINFMESWVEKAWWPAVNMEPKQKIRPLLEKYEGSINWILAGKALM